MTATAKKPNRRSTRHVMRAVRIPGAGKQLVWKCVQHDCHHQDHGGTSNVFGCPEGPPRPRW